MWLENTRSNMFRYLLITSLRLISSGLRRAHIIRLRSFEYDNLTENQEKKRSKLKKELKKLKRRDKALRKVMKRRRIQKIITASIAKRNRAEKRFRFYGMAAISVSLIFLVVLMCNIISSGHSAFYQAQIKLPITFTQEDVESQSYGALVNAGIAEIFPEATERSEKRKLNSLASTSAADQLKEIVKKDKTVIGSKQEVWLRASSQFDMLAKGKISNDSVDPKVIEGFEKLKNENRIRNVFNTAFFTQGDSRDPEVAGILGSMVGSLFVVISCMLVAFPLGVATAIYLEEFAPKNRITDFIEVNINNLAAVPSIVFGLLGLTIYIQTFGIPRSASLAGGFTLAMMALPVIVIATRTSIRAIPKSIRDGATALGATKLQVTFDHVIPLAMPGIMTGTILSIARILGETAPLLMIGMVAFIADIPSDFLSPATAMPVQIYLWSDSSEVGFQEKTSAAIIVLLAILAVANLFAAYLRKKFETRW